MDFGNEYQEELLLKLGNKDWWTRHGDLIRVDCFTQPYLSIAEAVLAKLHHGKRVSEAQIRQMGRRSNPCVKFTGVDQGDFEFDRRELIDFQKDSILRAAFTKGNILKEQGKHEEAVSVIVDARRRFPDVREGIRRDVLNEPGNTPKRVNVTAMGLKTFDTALDGGLGAGEVGVISGPANSGKSQFLVWLAIQGILQGKRVHVVTLEDSVWEVEKRLRRCLCQTKDTPVQRIWNKKVKTLGKKCKLIIREFPALTVSVRDIDMDIGGDIDLLILDYADEIRPPSGTIGMLYQDMGTIYSHLKQVATVRQVPLWTASQVNRGGYAFDSRTPSGLQHISDSLKKGQKADVVITLNQEEGKGQVDEKTGTTIVTAFLAKNRHGPRHHMVPLTVHFGMSMFKEGSWTE